MDLPILQIRKSEGEDALLRHKLTPDEQRLFLIFDAATAALPEDAEMSDYYDTVAKLGGEFGLTPDQSIPFFVRTTFRMFEGY